MAKDSQRLEQEFIANAKQNTGRDVPEWMTVIGTSGLDKPNAILNWLKETYKLNHMQAKGAKRVNVRLRPEDTDMPLLPWIDPKNFNPGYLMRALDLLPRRGDKPEWQHTQDYWTERKAIPAIDLDAAEFEYA